LITESIKPPELEYRFGAIAAGGRGKGLRSRLIAAGLKDWRFDICFPDIKLAVECEGGTWIQGRHVRGIGFENDSIKYNAAAELGFILLRYTTTMIKRDPTGVVGQIKRIYDQIHQTRVIHNEYSADTDCSVPSRGKG